MGILSAVFSDSFWVVGDISHRYALKGRIKKPDNSVFPVEKAVVGGIECYFVVFGKGQAAEGCKGLRQQVDFILGRAL